MDSKPWDSSPWISPPFGSEYVWNCFQAPNKQVYEFSNMPLQHTPNPQPTVYHGIPYICGFLLHIFSNNTTSRQKRHVVLLACIVGQKMENLRGTSSSILIWLVNLARDLTRVHHPKKVAKEGKYPYFREINPIENVVILVVTGILGWGGRSNVCWCHTTKKKTKIQKVV